MKYNLVTYNKIVDGYPEKTAIIVDIDNNIVDSIDFLFYMENIHPSLMKRWVSIISLVLLYQRVRIFIW